MKKTVILVFINLIIFILLRIISVLVAFLFGIGASAKTDDYSLYMLLIPLAVQLLMIILLFRKKKFITKKVELIILLIMTLGLFYLGQLEMIPF